jgi:hypothetical protein
MNSCDKCLENVWSLEEIDGWMRATCEMCSNEVVFPQRNAGKKKMKSTDDPCRKCGGELYWKTAKLNSKRQKKNYHYCKWLKCKKCRTPYMTEESKTLKGEACSCQKTIVGKKQTGWLKEVKTEFKPPTSYLINP